MTNRIFAPVAAPPPPKPPQLNLVASALMPDVSTDTMGPKATAGVLASAGWEQGRVGTRNTWNRPPGDLTMRTLIEERNALIAAIDSMSDVEMQQAEETVGVSPTSLPSSIYGASADSRWTGGFAYAPENQYPAVLADPCGQTIDLPGLTPPVVTGVNSSGGSHSLTSASYDYIVTAINANGESLGSSVVTVAVTSGSAQLTWADTRADITEWKVYGRTHNVSPAYLATVTSPSYLDDGTATPTAGLHAPIADGSKGPGSYGNLAQIKYVPFLIQVEDSCSSFGWSQRDFVGRALRLLDNATPQAIEREFWSGAFAQNTLTGPLIGSNGFLSQSATDTSGGCGVGALDLTPENSVPSVTRGIQILEDYLANTGFGGQGMLHVAPQTSPNLLGARRVGGLLLSVMDNIIVPGSGYVTTQGPADSAYADLSKTPNEAWIYASDLVSIRLDEPNVFPATLAEAMDRGLNTIRFRAQRFAAATTDMARLAACRVQLSS